MRRWSRCLRRTLLFASFSCAEPLWSSCRRRPDNPACALPGLRAELASAKMEIVVLRKGSDPSGGRDRAESPSRQSLEEKDQETGCRGAEVSESKPDPEDAVVASDL